MFDHDLFHANATQLRMFADDYAALDLTAEEAADCANRGFTPGEVACQMGACDGHDHLTVGVIR